MRRHSLYIGALAAGLLATAGVADARMHAPYRGHRIVLGATAPLDGFTQPSGAYSFRLLRKAYLGLGAAVRLRRASDNAEADIGFVGDNFDTVTAEAHCAATSCFLRTWYDQSGNAKHLQQTTAANQLALIFNCNGTLPCFRFTTITQSALTATNTAAGSAVSLSAVGRRLTGTAQCGWVRSSGATGNRLWSANGANNWVLSPGPQPVITVPAADTAWHAAVGVIDGTANSVLNVDGTEVTGTQTVIATAATGGIQGVTTGPTCDVAEAMWWDTYGMTAGERTALMQNQRDYWLPAPLDTFTAPSGAYSFRKLKSSYTGPAIRIRRASDNLETDINFLGYVPGIGSPWDEAAANAHCAATSCFLTTWYDQSGNARHLVQATTTNQPQLIFNCTGSLPCVRQAGSATIGLATAAGMTPGAAVSLSAVARRAAGSVQCIWIKENGNAGNRLISGAAALWGLQGGATNISAAAADSIFHAANGVMDGTAASVFNLNGVETTGTVTPAATVTNAGMFGVGAATCDVAEGMWWDPYKLTAGERAGLIVNQRSFWGTP